MSSVPRSYFLEKEMQVSEIPSLPWQLPWSNQKTVVEHGVSPAATRVIIGFIQKYETFQVHCKRPTHMDIKNLLCREKKSYSFLIEIKLHAHL